MTEYKCWFSQVERCPVCESKKLLYGVTICSNETTQARVKCLSCGHAWAAKQWKNEAEGPSITMHGKWAKAVKERDGHCCRICGSRTDLHAHHLIPKSHDPQGQHWWNVNNGVTVCRVCHRMIHGWEL